MLAEVGAVVILAGIVCQVIQLVVSIRDRQQLRDLTGDPWNARTLEWSTASPPPAWNFAVLPRVAEKDAFWAAKQRGTARQDASSQGQNYRPIEMPENSAVGFITAFFAVASGFALIWHIWWLACLGVVGAFVATLFFAFRDKDEIEIPSEQLVRFDRAHPAGVAL